MGVQKTILFIEDEKELLTEISRLLRENDFAVAPFTTAEEALIFLQQSTPDLILADVKLPGLDGFDLFDEIRKNDRVKNVPVIFITAFNNQKAMKQAKKIGVREYITKPFDLDFLISRILAVLS